MVETLTALSALSAPAWIILFIAVLAYLAKHLASVIKAWKDD